MFAPYQFFVALTCYSMYHLLPWEFKFDFFNLRFQNLYNLAGEEITVCNSNFICIVYVFGVLIFCLFLVCKNFSKYGFICDYLSNIILGNFYLIYKHQI